MKRQDGQTLMEVLLAFGVLMLTMSAVIFGIATSLSSAQYAKNQSLANLYAQEGMAVVRQIRDSSWSNFCSNYGNVNYCLSKDNKIFSFDNNNCGNYMISGIFVRKVELIRNSTDCCPPTTTPCSSGTCLTSTIGTKATVRVSWTDNKCPIGTPYCHKVELITCFSNIDQKKAP